MPRKAIKTAEEHVQDLDTLTARRKREEEEFKRKQKELEDIRDMRDDVMSMIRNARLSYEDIHAMFGPHPDTLKAWDLKKIDSPRMGKMRAALRAIGKDFYIGEYSPKKPRK